jgi:hypothetical protein
LQEFRSCRMGNDILNAVYVTPDSFYSSSPIRPLGALRRLWTRAPDTMFTRPREFRL